VPTDDDFEQYLPGVLRSAVEAYPGPSPDLVRRGIATGRRQRRARVLRSAAVVAVLTISGIAAASARFGAFDGSSSHSTPANEQTRIQTPTPSPSPSTFETPMPSASPSPVAGRIDLVPLLHQALAGVVTDAPGTYDLSGPRATRPASAVVTGSYGRDGRTTRVSVEISRPVPGTEEAKASRTTCVEADNVPTAKCERVTVPGMANALVWTESAPLAHASFDLVTVVLVRADGGVVSVTSGGEPTTRTADTTEPVMKTGLMIDVARSSVWDKVVAAQTQAGERLLPLIPTMLPEGTHISTAVTGNNEHASFTVSDAKGRSDVYIDLLANAAAAYRGCGELPDAGTCAGSDLLDGTRVVTTTVADSAHLEGGVQSWEVVAYHQNGLRVLVSQTNSRDGQELLRSTPVLTLEQLTRLASDPRWHA
jgi:hypothetical protein